MAVKITSIVKIVNVLYPKVNGSVFMEAPENKIQERNREIGRIVKEARSKKNISVTTCANLIDTSRRRYVAMEEGEAIIGMAELEVLIKFLEIPINKVWYGKNTLTIPRQVIVEALPGETLQIVVDIREQ